MPQVPPVEPSTREDGLTSAVVTLLDVAITGRYDPMADETFLYCHVCGEWEGHEEECPVPLLERWLSQQSTRSS